MNRPCPNDSKTDKFGFVKILTSTINFMTRDDLILSYLWNKILGLWQACKSLDTENKFLNPTPD